MIQPSAVRSTTSRRYALAHDASHYYLLPASVEQPANVQAVSSLFQQARETGGSLTFRSGGTSLSGQGVTNATLVDTRRHFRSIEILDNGERVRAAPGATVRQVNAALARHGRKLGPDPASEVACTIGGVVANNSSGMACGVEYNSYRTIDSMVVVLADGSIIDTGAPDAEQQLLATTPELVSGLNQLRSRVLDNNASVETTRRLFARKNTMGYSVNSFLDFDRVSDLIAHLLVGSEGTLGFISEVTFRTVPLQPFAATGLAVFPTLTRAAAAASVFADAGFATVELMDATSLRVAQQLADCPDDLTSLEVHEHAALLVELQAATSDELDAKVNGVRGSVTSVGSLSPMQLSNDPTRRNDLWRIRKGLYTSVAGARPTGTTALLEDIVVPVERLAEACEGLIELFDRHGYEQSVIFGHAKDGNVHFMLNERFDRPELLDRYRSFTEDMVELVLQLDGSLKAEHGTGRVMAPFVERQYGSELYSVMREVKRLFDPTGLLNPGVIITDDPDAHLRSLKVTPSIEQEVDRCVECGYCEPACPSKDLTLTPRQRIVLRRDMADATARGDRELLEILTSEYEYEGIQTCAVDGMCAAACPVGINTGDLVRRLRAEASEGLEAAAWAGAAGAWAPGTAAVSAALTAAHAFPEPLVHTITRVGRAIAGDETVPLYQLGLPRGGHRRKARSTQSPVAVYFPSCTGTMFGDDNALPVSEAFLALCERAAVEVTIPEHIAGLCCGTPWKSKGHLEGYRRMTEKVQTVLATAAQGGLPVVCDASSCTEGLVLQLRELGLRVIDSIAFAREYLLPRLEVTKRLGALALHPTCSSHGLGIDDDLNTIARALAIDVTTPLAWNCCGFAGDRGLLHPELTYSATSDEAAEVRSAAFDGYASTNRTCELGLSRAVGQPYRHILVHLEAATR